MEQENNEFELCETCKQQIHKSKIDLHEGFCRRNNKICNYCDEVILKDEQNQHEKEKHIPCIYCKKMVQESLILAQIHQENCLQKGVQCKLCQVSFIKSEIKEHIEHCSAKSDTCLNCMKMVLRKNREKHEEQCIGQKFNLIPVMKKTISNKIMHAQKNLFNTISDFDFLEILREQVSLLQQQLHISQGKSIQCLYLGQWDNEKAFQIGINYLDLLDISKNNKIQNKQQEQIQKFDKCLICLQSFQENIKPYNLKCNHKACENCYQEYIQEQINYGQQMLISPCIINECQEIIGQDDYQKFLNNNQFIKYLHYLQENALETSPHFIACPKKLCSLILQCRQETFNVKEQLFNIMCPNCETYFCNFCKEQPHKPLQCEKYNKFINLEYEQDNSLIKQHKAYKGYFTIFSQNRKNMLTQFENKIVGIDEKQLIYEIFEYSINLIIETFLNNSWAYANLYLLQKEQGEKLGNEELYKQVVQTLNNYQNMQSEFNKAFKRTQEYPSLHNAIVLKDHLSLFENWIDKKLTILEDLNKKYHYN